MAFMKREDFVGRYYSKNKKDGSQDIGEFGYSLYQAPSYKREVLGQGIDCLGKSIVISVSDKLALSTGDVVTLADGNKYRFVAITPRFDDKDRRRARFTNKSSPVRWFITLE